MMAVQVKNSTFQMNHFYCHQTQQLRDLEELDWTAGTLATIPAQQ